ncbi:MAG: CRISPR-associated endonuclease Cas1 [Pseudomonadota bacterium]
MSDEQVPLLPLELLLPLRAVEVTLRFIKTGAPKLFHQPALTAWLRFLAGDVPGYEQYISLDAPAKGHIDYQPDDQYRFSLTITRGGEALLQHLMRQFELLPRSAVKRPGHPAFSDNLMLVEMRDLFQQHTVRRVDDLSTYTFNDLQQEAQLWTHVQQCTWRWLSPVRLLRPKEQREEMDGEMRFCRHVEHLSFQLLYDRVYDSLAEPLRNRGAALPARYSEDAPRLLSADVFWTDFGYHDSQGHEKPMGGLLGAMWLDITDLSPALLDCWILGQYLGIGQRRAFGWGRYELSTPDGDSTLTRCAAPSLSLLRKAMVPENLHDAYIDVADRGVEVDVDTERLNALGERLLQGEYVIPPAQEKFIPKPSGNEKRRLNIPPFWDRVLQRAVMQVIAPALDTLMYHGSFGYRLGRSRHAARDMIQMAYRDGYRWVFESDINDFFETVPWAHLLTRLDALFGEDPVASWLLRWMQAPLTLEDGATVERRAGLPPGSPLSPVLANLVLDDFDNDLSEAGLRLVRFADDFVVLCKTQEEAEAVADQVTAALAEVGLKINLDKTGVRSFSQGFRFLGYLFVNSVALDAGGEKAPTATIVTQAAKDDDAANEDDPIKLGELEERGTLVFVTGAPAIVATESGRLQVVRTATNETTKMPTPEFSLPWRLTQAVVLIGGQHHITTPALRTAMSHNVPVHFADAGGNYQGSAWSAPSSTGANHLWPVQIAWFGIEDNALLAARSLIHARLKHQREVLRQRNTAKRFDAEIRTLDEFAARAASAASLESLRGFEGQGAKVYWQTLQTLVPDEFRFRGRLRQPPPDPFNALLSLGYSILFSHLETVIRVNGLMPGVGIYHQPHGAHPVLVSDLMEPFRHIIERVALNALTRKQLKAADFKRSGGPGCRLTDAALKKYLAMLHERFETPFHGIRQDEPQPLHPHLQWQVQQVIAWLRGQGPEYVA